MISALLSVRKARLLPFVAGLVLLIALADHAVGNRMSLGVLYVLPMMLGALVLRPTQIVVLALLCSSLRSWFDLPSPHIEMLLRFIFALIAYSACGLVVAELIRNRQATIAHLERIGREQALRREAEEQLKTLVESSPAAIFTVDESGIAIAVNNAANQMFALTGRETLKGRSIAGYLPLLADALQLGSQSGELKTAAQCQGRRENGEVFLADIWFSSYTAGDKKRLAAIVVDSSEEMREHEEENLRLLRRGNLIAVSAVAHEVRNLSSAISVVTLNLREKHGLAFDEEFQTIESLIQGLDRVAAVGLRSREDDIEDLPLQTVLDDLRIVIESDWREIDGAVYWNLPPVSPRVLAERHGLLQVFLNLAQNANRAVQSAPVRELHIDVEADHQRALIRFRDSGHGVASPENLFQPFQSGAEGNGLGLYVSRAAVRGYGGELRYEPRPHAGACFAVELQVVATDDAAPEGEIIGIHHAQ
jgi:PAS domain S-box-containing protein